MLDRCVMTRRGATLLALLLGAWLACAAQARAGSLDDFVFDGAGNLLVFDAAAGTGGWNGAITAYADPGMAPPLPLSLASLVLFSFNDSANLLTGQFEFTDAADLSSSVFGTLSGSFTDAASTLQGGGQFALDYLVDGGTGRFAGYRGFGLSFLSFDPNATGFDNYSEQGLLAAAVPEPASVWPLAAGLAWLARVSRRRARPPAGA